MPTLPIGDFNQIKHAFDKFGGTTRIKGWDTFSQWKMEIALLNIPFVGSKFAWSNNQFQGELIFERLDHPYSTPNWLDAFNGSYLFNFPILCSDHGLVMLHVESRHHLRGTPYKLEV